MTRILYSQKQNILQLNCLYLIDMSKLTILKISIYFGWEICLVLTQKVQEVKVQQGAAKYQLQMDKPQLYRDITSVITKPGLRQRLLLKIRLMKINMTNELYCKYIQLMILQLMELRKKQKQHRKLERLKVVNFAKYKEQTRKIHNNNQVIQSSLSMEDPQAGNLYHETPKNQNFQSLKSNLIYIDDNYINLMPNLTKVNNNKNSLLESKTMKKTKPRQLYTEVMDNLDIEKRILKDEDKYLRTRCLLSKQLRPLFSEFELGQPHFTIRKIRRRMPSEKIIPKTNQARILKIQEQITGKMIQRNRRRQRNLYQTKTPGPRSQKLSNFMLTPWDQQKGDYSSDSLLALI